MAVMQLINLGITQALIKLLVNLQHTDSISSEALTREVLWLLGQVRDTQLSFYCVGKVMSVMSE